MVHPDDLDKTMMLITKHLEGKSEVYRAEFRMKCSDGSWKWILDVGQIFEWDKDKSRSNNDKHGIDFHDAKKIWNDSQRVEIETSYPFENRSILIGKIGEKHWTAIFTKRRKAIRIISVRRSRKKEVRLYEQKENSEDS